MPHGVLDVAQDAEENEGDLAEAIVFVATVEKVQTLVDQGLRVTLDLPESAIMQAAMLMECKRMGVVLEVKAMPTVQDETNSTTADGKKGRPTTKSLRGGG